MICTGSAVSASARLMCEPVTSTFSVPRDSFASCASDDGAGNRHPAQAIASERLAGRVAWFVCMVFSPRPLGLHLLEPVHIRIADRKRLLALFELHAQVTADVT